MKKKTFQNVRNLPYWMLISGIYTLIKVVPYPLLLTLGKNIGRFAHLTLKKRKLIAHDNIKKCFPNLSENELKTLTKKNFESLGIGIIELCMSWFYSKRKLNKHTRIEGLEHIDPNHGALMVTGHFSNVEIANRIHSLKTNKNNIGNYVVYPKHGVGKITAIEKAKI